MVVLITRHFTLNTKNLTDLSPDEIKQTSTCNDFLFRQYKINYYTIQSPFLGQNRYAYGSNLNCSWTIALNATACKRVGVWVDSYGTSKNDILSIYSGNYASKVLLNSYTNTYPSFNRYGITYKAYRFISDAWEL